MRSATAASQASATTSWVRLRASASALQAARRTSAPGRLSTIARSPTPHGRSPSPSSNVTRASASTSSCRLAQRALAVSLRSAQVASTDGSSRCRASRPRPTEAVGRRSEGGIVEHARRGVVRRAPATRRAPSRAPPVRGWAPRRRRRGGLDAPRRSRRRTGAWRRTGPPRPACSRRLRARWTSSIARPVASSDGAEPASDSARAASRAAAAIAASSSGKSAPSAQRRGAPTGSGVVVTVRSYSRSRRETAQAPGCSTTAASARTSIATNGSTASTGMPSTGQTA